MSHILLVEDEQDLAQMLGWGLELVGHQVDHVTQLKEARNQLRKQKVDLILLDRMLPDGNGVELCRWLRNREDSTPILILTAMSEETDVLCGLESGADDYVFKPFSSKILQARIAALLRRHQGSEPAELPLQAGEIILDRQRALVQVQGKEITLTPIEFSLLEALIKAQGCVLSREQLLDKIHRGEQIVTLRSVDVHMVSLRRKLGLKDFISTVRGWGYRFQQPA